MPRPAPQSEAFWVKNGFTKAGEVYPNDYSAWWELKRIADEGRFFYDGFYGANSEFMNERWSSILSEQLIAYTKIITGEVGVDEGFDAWLASFDSLGGGQITEEVNEWYHNH